MLRLCRQFSCTSRCSRVQRVQPLSRTRQALSTSLGRRYTSSDEPVKQYDKFDRLFASLRHGMDEDELAKTIAALVLSTSSKTKLDKIEMSVPQYTKEFNRNSLFTKVNHYLTHPPEDNFYSLAAQTPSGMIVYQILHCCGLHQHQMYSRLHWRPIHQYRPPKRTSITIRKHCWQGTRWK